VTTAFVVEFLGDGRWRALSGITEPPLTTPLPLASAGTPVAADLHLVPGSARQPGLVLVHGLAEAGKDDARVRDAAGLLARAGWAVAVPSVPGLTHMRLRPEDARPVEAAARALAGAGHRPVALVAVSLGAGPAVIAAAELSASHPPAVPLSAVLLLGGYASSRELLRFALTGDGPRAHAPGGRPMSDEAIARFVDANADLLDRSAGAALVASRDSAQVDALLAALPPSTRQLLDHLSPEAHLPRFASPIFLVHGRQDPVVPFTESLRLERAARSAGHPVRLALVGAVDHVEGGRAHALADTWRLWATFYAFRLTATTAAAH
jgi:pimeloyl-ACP methyl ester carboxylesterase